MFYLDWLLDHQGEFTLAVMQKLGPEASSKIDWSGPRLLCIAGDFTKYDEYAVLQIPRSVELLRYRRYGPDLLLLELVNAGAESLNNRHGKAAETTPAREPRAAGPAVGDKLLDLWESLKAFLLALGDNVTMKQLEHYVAFRRIKNFACVKMQHSEVVIWAKVNPKTVELQEPFTRDVINLGHLGTGNLQIRLASATDLERAKPLLVRSYQQS